MSIYLKAEAERLAAMCSSGDTRNCPRPGFGQICPNVYCDDVEPEHWLEILKKEAEKCKCNINGTLFILESHLERARKKYPEFKGVTCVLREVADLIKADEAEDKSEVKRQALHVAVTALRLYEGD